MDRPRLRKHSVYLSTGLLRLRPLAEEDFPVLFKWNRDPEFLYYAEEDPSQVWTLESLREMYRYCSDGALMFLVTLDGHPIGDVWFQQMNIKGIHRRHPNKRLYRMPIFIGETRLWGQGWGTRIIRLVAEYCFDQTDADALVAVGVADYNPRSRRAFEKNGFVVDKEIQLPKGSKAAVEYDMMLTRERFEQITANQ